MSEKKSGAGYGLVFANFGFMLLFAGQMISYLGDRLDQFTLLALARGKESADPDTVMTRMAIFLVLPFVLFAPFIGPVVDRFSRKSILIVSHVFQGAIVLSIPFIRHTEFVQAHAVAMIYLTIFLIGSFTAFFAPAKTALVPEIVQSEALMAANSLTTFAGTIMTMLGAFLAAWMLRLYERGGISLDICFYIDAATYYVSGAMFLFIFVPKKAAAVLHHEPFTRQISEAVRYVKAHARPFQLVLLTGCFSGVAGFVYALINAKTLNEMRAPTSTYGLLTGVFGLAIVAGGLAMTFFHRRLPSYEGFAAQAFVAVAVFIYWIAAAGEWRIALPQGWGAAASKCFLRVEGDSLLLTEALLPIIGVGFLGGALMVFITTTIQKSVPKRYHGRIFALSNLVYFVALIGTMWLGTWLQGFVREGRWSLRAIAAGVAVLPLAVSVGIVASTEWLRSKWLRRLTWSILKVYCRIEIEGRENVPKHGPLIVAANHVSWIDTVLIGVAVPRLVQYVAAEQYYNKPLLRPIMRFFGTIPLREKGGAAGVVKAAIDLLERGRLFGIFPEGHLSNDGRMQQAKEGVGLLAAKTGARILPVALIGAHDVFPRHRRFPRPAKVRVRIGAPIDPSGKSRDEITVAVMSTIADLAGQKWSAQNEEE